MTLAAASIKVTRTTEPANEEIQPPSSLDKSIERFWTLESKSPELDELKRMYSESGSSSTCVQQLEERFAALLMLIKTARDAALGDLEQKEQAMRGIDELAAALDQVTKTTEQVEASVADRSTNASVFDAQLAVIGEPMARVDEIIGSVERLSAQPLSADQTKQVVAMGDKAKDLRDRLLAAKQTMEAWLMLHRDYDHAKQSMTSRVTDMEAEAAAIDAKYQQTRPLAEAVEDSRTIQLLLTAVQDERTHIGAVQDIAARLGRRFDSSQFESELLEGIETNGAGPAIGAYNDVNTVSSDATSSRLLSWPFVTLEDDYDETTWFLPNNTMAAAVNTDSNNNYRKWNLRALTDYCKKSSGAVVVSPVRKKSTLAPSHAKVCPMPKRVEPAYNRIDVNAAQRAVLAFWLRIPDEDNRQTLPSSVPSTPFASDIENARDAPEKVLKKSSAKEQETRHAERPETSRHADGKHKSNKRMCVSSDSDSDGGQPAKKLKRASVTPNRDNLEKSPEVVDSPRRMKAMLDKYCSVRFSSSSKANHSSKHSPSPKLKKHSAAPFSGHHKKILFSKAPSPTRFGASALSESARKHKMEQNERERRRQQQIVSGQWTEQRSRAHERSAQLKKFAEAARRKQAEEDAA